MDTSLTRFHPAVAAWFAGRFQAPTPPQHRAWPAILSGRHTLIAAPTGSGKTLAAFLAAIDALVRRAAVEELPAATDVVYVSPLKALSNDIHCNLEAPLREIAAELQRRGHADPGIRTMVRTGDTPTSLRAAMTRRPPHILVTTPESLYILLTSEGGRRMLQTVGTAIVDEIHAVAGDKRGAHLALSLERLAELTARQGRPLVRVGLSATQRPIDEMARFLVGSGHVDDAGRPDCHIVDEGHRRTLDLALELPGSPLGAVMEAEVWDEVYDGLARLVREHRTTLVFVATRKMAERVTRHLGERLGAERVGAHHGSLSRELRLDAERRLRSGQLQALVATASLELGIDVGDVDLVCNIGSTRSIATLLQRVGRSGHSLGRTPRGRLFPTTRDELIECLALTDAVRRGELEQLEIPLQPLDILAQQIVAMAACEDRDEADLYDRIRRAWPYRALSRQDFDDVLTMLDRGFATDRGRRGALLHRDRVGARVRGRRGARLAAITSGGAIPDNADFRVTLEPQGTLVGTVDEDFAIESMPGDVFQLGNASWRIQRVEQGQVRVEDARGQPPTIPFWLGEAPGRSDALSSAVSRLRADLDRCLADSTDAALQWLTAEVGAARSAAEQAVEYLATARAALGRIPTCQSLVLERFFDEAGDQHVVLHSPYGTRINRAWGLALRKRFCRQFNFELQAAATADAIVLSLGPSHSYPAADTFRFLHSSSARAVLTQALLDAPMFGIRWRWNANRALALLRWRGGRRVPPQLQRMHAEDLIAVVFPDQLACLENIAGEREIPDHPLVRETLRDCLEEAMDVVGLERLLGAIERGDVTCEVRELREPSPLAHEILNARPYAFLDDAPLEERRTQAVRTRRWIDPADAAELGRLDSEVIRRTAAQVWPDPRDAEELHDALVTAGALTEAEGQVGGWCPWFEELIRAGRATRLDAAAPTGALWVAAESLALWQAVLPAASLAPPIAAAPEPGWESPQADAARIELIRRRLQIVGPRTVDEIAAPLGLSPQAVADALARLEAQGVAMQGQFRSGVAAVEWCERGLLARIHRGTLQHLRREIEPVSRADFMRFLLDWQRVTPDRRAAGPDSVEPLLRQLEGFEAPAAAWESEILPARLTAYDPQWLDASCLSGRRVWARVSPPSAPASRPIRTTPLALLGRECAGDWFELARLALPPEDATPSPDVCAIADHLTARGASFFHEIVRATGQTTARVETGLATLVSEGRVTADSFTGMRALLTPAGRRPSEGRRRGTSTTLFAMENAGRWSLLDRPPTAAGPAPTPAAEALDRVARTLLARYGVVFRRLLLRESLAPPWRALLGVYRRLEARGEVRGGRFVDGFSGEQFALPEAVGRLRAVRRLAPSGVEAVVSGADPLNLCGIVVGETRVAARTRHRILFRDGVPRAVLEAGEVRFIDLVEPAEQWQARQRLLRRRIPPRLRGYLGRSA